MNLQLFIFISDVSCISPSCNFILITHFRRSQIMGGQEVTSIIFFNFKWQVVSTGSLVFSIQLRSGESSNFIVSLYIAASSREDKQTKLMNTYKSSPNLYSKLADTTQKTKQKTANLIGGISLWEMQNCEQFANRVHQLTDENQIRIQVVQQGEYLERKARGKSPCDFDGQHKQTGLKS